MSAFATSASRASASVTSSENGPSILQVRSELLCAIEGAACYKHQRRRPHSRLLLHTDCDLDAGIGQNLDGRFSYKASSKQQCFPRVAQFGLDSCNHRRHSRGLIGCATCRSAVPDVGRERP
jgi:hypothetical protein